MSGMDEQFYPCPCGKSYGWFIKTGTYRMHGWLLDPKSSRRERKRENGINVVHLYEGLQDMKFKDYINRIRFFKCRVCDKTIRKGAGVDRLINFIRRNWDERTVRRSR